MRRSTKRQDDPKHDVIPRHGKANPLRPRPGRRGWLPCRVKCRPSILMATRCLAEAGRPAPAIGLLAAILRYQAIEAVLGTVGCAKDVLPSRSCRSIDDAIVAASIVMAAVRVSRSFRSNWPLTIGPLSSV